MDKKLIGLLIAVFVLFAGCTSQSESSDDEIQLLDDSNNRPISNGEQVANEAIENLDVSDETKDEIKKTIVENKEEISQKANEIIDENNLETTIENTNVEIKEDGSVSIDVDDTLVQSNQELGSIDEWCVPGTEYMQETAEGSASGTIIGPTTFKDDVYCEAISETEIAGQIIEAKYYFKDGGTDLWLVSNIYGQDVEQHIVLE